MSEKKGTGTLLFATAAVENHLIPVGINKFDAYRQMIYL
jgi:hypothetical protein